MRAWIAISLVLVLAGCGGPSVTPEVSPSPSASPTAPAATDGGLATVRVFFVPGGRDPCGTVGPVVRKVGVPEGGVTPSIVLGELLAGPTAEEAAAGFTSLFGPPTVDALLEAPVVDGIVRVSFRDLRSILPEASSSCGSSALLAALDATLAQLPGIRSARYSFAGDEAAFYEWLQLAPPD